MRNKFLLGFVFILMVFNLSAKSNEIGTTKEELKEVLDSVVTVKNVTDGSGGANGEYVLFCIWPQDKKSDNVKIDTSATENINGWYCYKGSDDSYYVKAGATPYDDYKFDDGTDIERSNKKQLWLF